MSAPASLDAELVLTTWLSQQLSVATCTELPADFAVPIIRIFGVSGTDDGYKFEIPVIDVDCFHVDFPSVSLLARQANHTLTKELPGQIVAGALVTKVHTTTRPRWLNWADPDVRHFSATYQVWLNAA